MRHAWVLVALAFFVPLFVSGQAVCPSLSLGSSGTSVLALQRFLSSAYSNFPTPTGYFGSLTQAAVKQWQGEHAISQTGTVGPITAAAMKLCGSSARSSSVPFATTIVSASAVGAPPRTLVRGMSGTDVSALQATLVSKGLLASDSATGFFGALTEAAVQKFQSQNGIVSSGSAATNGYGAIGPKTRVLLYMSNTTAPASNPPTASPSTPTASVSTYPSSANLSCPIARRPSVSCNGSWQSVTNDNGCTVGWQCQSAAAAAAPVSSVTPVSVQPQASSLECPYAAKPTSSCSGSWQTKADERGCTLAWQCAAFPAVQTITNTVTKNICADITPPSCTGALTQLGTDSNGCNKGYLCSTTETKTVNVLTCPTITPPSCTGSIASLGTDTNGCNRGYVCTVVNTVIQGIPSQMAQAPAI